MNEIHFVTHDAAGELRELAVCVWDAVPRQGERVKLDGLADAGRLGEEDPPTEAVVFVVERVLHEGESTMVLDAILERDARGPGRLDAADLRRAAELQAETRRRHRVSVLLSLPPEERTWAGLERAAEAEGG